MEVARRFSPDPAVHERVVRDVLRHAAEMDFSRPPPAAAQHMRRVLRGLTGVDDPYRSAKDLHNRRLLELLPSLAARTAAAADPLEAATRLAIAGNVIDLGTKSGLTEEEVFGAVAGALDVPVAGDLPRFLAATRAARRILYVADNAGEIVLDRILIETLGPERVTLVVRGAPVLNDATVEDAKVVGLAALVEVIGNGSDAPGTILDECAEDVRRRFRAADLVIAKGQGNYETLNEEKGPVFFLLKIKCAVVAADTGLPVGAHALLAPRVHS